MHRPITTLAVVTTLLLASAAAHANTPLLLPWANNTYSYRINEASFANNLNGLSLTGSQTRYWVRWSLAQWGALSGSGLITTEGSTTTLGDSRSECLTNQQTAYSFIGVVNGCETPTQCTQACIDDPDCPVSLATNVAYYDGNGRITNSQTCIWGPTADWEVDADSLSMNEKDIVGVLTHELGHALTLMDYLDGGGVMHPTSFGLGNTFARVPFTDDINAIRTAYGTAGTNDLRVGIYDDAGTFEWITISTNRAWWRYGATILEHPSTGSPWVVYAGPTTSSNAVQWSRTPYPVTAASTWTHKSINEGSWHPVRMVSNEERTVAAWVPKAIAYYDVPPIRFLRTTNAFDTGNPHTLDDSYTLHPVSIAYDPSAERYIMAYLRFSWIAAENNRIMLRVSDDGLSWDDPIDTTIRSSLAPSVACSDGECVLTYNHRGVNAYPYHREISVSPVDNDVDVSSVATSIAERSVAPPAAAGRTLSSDIMLLWSNAGATDVRFEPATTVPVVFDEQYWVSTGARYGGEIGAYSDHPSTNYNPHIFYVIR